MASPREYPIHTVWKDVKVAIVGLTVCTEKIIAELIFIEICAVAGLVPGLAVDTFELGQKVIWRLNFFCVLRWWLLDVLQSRVPLCVWANGVEKGNCRTMLVMRTR